VWVADEFYIEAGRGFPSRASYEEMPQFENGVGMAREFVTMFNRRRTRLRGLKSRRRVMFLTGKSALPMMETEILPFVRNELKLNLAVEAVDNIFWGESVTVSGLLTGEDILKHAQPKKEKCDLMVLPPNCLNDDDLFLDDMSLDQFRGRLGMNVVVGKYNLVETLREVFA
jgi:NifB/MoaA-like Fe-S oxidoreductase